MTQLRARTVSQMEVQAMLKLLSAILVMVSLCGCRTSEADRYVGAWEFRGDFHTSISLDLLIDKSYTMDVSISRPAFGRSIGSWEVKDDRIVLSDPKRGTINLRPIDAEGVVALAWEPDNLSVLGSVGYKLILKKIILKRKESGN